MRRYVLLLCILVLMFSGIQIKQDWDIGIYVYAEESTGRTYYVDYENGNDANSGLSQEQAWKHAPIDLDAKDESLAAILNPGDVSSARVDLSWNRSTDNVGVAGYRVYSDGTQSQSVTVTTPVQQENHEPVLAAINQGPVIGSVFAVDPYLTDIDMDGVETFHVKASGVQVDGSITNYTWKTGDTVHISGRYNVHGNITLPIGVHEITLEVTDDSGRKGSAFCVVEVEEFTGDYYGLKALKDYPAVDRFPLNDRIWSQEYGNVSICLWADDKWAAVNLSIDDNCKPDHEWWISKMSQYNWKMTWFVITHYLEETRDYDGNLLPLGSNFFGSWDDFKRLHNMGHVVGSHSVSHRTDFDQKSDDFVNYEMEYSQYQIRKNIPGAEAIVACSKTSKGEIVSRYYIADRGAGAIANPANRIFYMKPSDGADAWRITNLERILFDSNPAYKRGWLCPYMHAIPDEEFRSKIEVFLQYMKDHEDELWIDTFVNQAEYGQERDTCFFENINVSDTGISFELKDRMLDTLFDYPLTVKVCLGNSWSGKCVATQNGSPIETSVVEKDGYRYALVKAIPDKGIVNIFTADNHPPVLKHISPKTFYAGTELVLNLEAVDNDHQILEYRADQMPEGSEFDAESHVFRWLAQPSQAGKYFVDFRVTDGQDEDYQRVEIQVLVDDWDDAPPSTPMNLSGTAISQNAINLIWTDSTDNVGITGYRVYRNGIQVGTSESNSYTDTGLTTGTTYSYTVSAYDAAGNMSEQCAAVSASTLTTAMYYVRTGASGANDGSDWNNAWTQLPTSLQRGATYYIASGNYLPYRFDDPEDGSLTITVKKATLDDHGTQTGWLNEYASGQALFTAEQGPIFEFQTGYYAIDGQTGEQDAGHGIKLKNNANIAGYAGGNCMMIPGGTDVQHLTLRHIEMHDAGWAGSLAPAPALTRTIFVPGRTAHIAFQYCYIHDSGQEWLIFADPVTDFLVEHCYFKNGGSGDNDYHSVGLWFRGENGNQNIHIRYNTFENFSAAGGTGYISLGYRGNAEIPTYSSGHYIYGNIFKETSHLAGPSRVIGSNGANGGPVLSDVKIFNNTFYHMIGSYSQRIILANEGNDNLVANNIWYDCDNTPSFANIEETNNIKNDLTYDPFIDASNGDFRLLDELPGGKILDEPFNKDLSGITRGADGSWDIGAYEYVEDSVTNERPYIENNTLLAADGFRLRGGTFWLYGWIPSKTTWALSDAPWQAIQDNNLNAVRVACAYRPEKDNNYTIDQYENYLDQIIERAELAGVTVVIDYHPQPGYYYNISDSSNSDTYENNKQHARDFWTHIATRYKDKKNVVFELVNEPIFDGPNDYSLELLEDFEDLWHLCHGIAPETPIIILSFCQVGNHQSDPNDWPANKTGQLEDIDWSKTAVGFHSYWRDSSERIVDLKDKYPCINTEFMTYPNGTELKEMDGYEHHGSLMETLGISWLQWDILDRAESLNNLDVVIADLKDKGLYWAEEDIQVPKIEDMDYTAEYNTIYLTWVNPSEQDENWDGVLVIRKEGETSPAGPEDGEIIYNGIRTSVIDRNLDEGKYCYAVYTYKEFDNNTVYSESEGVGPIEIPETYNKEYLSIKAGVEEHQFIIGQNTRNDLYSLWNDEKLSISKGPTGNETSLWLYSDIIGIGENQIPLGSEIVSARLVFNVEDCAFKHSSTSNGDTEIINNNTHSINIYQITDPDNLGMPYYAEEDGIRTGLDFYYRDHRPGMNIAWKRPEDDTNSSPILDLIKDIKPVDIIEFSPDIFENQAVQTLEFDITKAVQSWVDGEENQGLYISTGQDWNNAEELNLSGVHGDEAEGQPPYLQIVYGNNGDNSDLTAPDPVENLLLKTTDNSIVLTWTNPIDTDFAGVKIVRKEGIVPYNHQDGEFVIFLSSDEENNDSYSDSGLLAGKTYYYAIFSYDEDHNYSKKTWVKGMPGSPAAPNFIGSPVMVNGELRLSWNRVSGVEGYRIYREDNSCSDIPSIGDLTAGYTSDNVKCVEIRDGLANSYSDYLQVGTYTYWLTAVNEYGEGPESSKVAVEIGEGNKAAEEPEAPTGFTGESISGSEVKLSWSDNSNNESGFVIERINDDGEWEEIFTTVYDVTEFIDRGLKPGTVYKYRIKAVNSAGESDYAECEVLTEGIADISWQVISASQVKVCWESLQNASYKVELMDREANILIEQSSNNNYCYFVRLEPDTEYRVTITAIIGGGEKYSTKSDIIRTDDDAKGGLF